MDIISQIVQAAIEHPTPEMFKWFFERTQDHIGRVANNMLRVADHFDLDKQKLVQLGKEHDASKYSIEEFIPYVFLSWDYKMKQDNKEYTLPEGMQKEIDRATLHHIRNNRHHPEHFKNGINDMTLIDILEMLCDWKAATLRHENGDILKSIKINKDRFGLSDQLVSIFKNTVDSLNWERR